MSEKIVEVLLNMMTPEQKAELISKLQDPDLPLENTAYVEKDKAKPEKNTKIDVGDFTMTRDKPEQKTKQLEVKQRKNLFIDDGKDHQNEQNKTPDIILTNRSRPKFEKVEQVCQHCQRSEMVHPQFAREFYTCVKCASGGAKR